MYYRRQPERNCISCLTVSACCFFSVGLILAIVGGIGYPISLNQQKNFDETRANITSFEPLKSKRCSWCQMETYYDPCCTRTCDTDGNNCNCNGCSKTRCNYISYTCYKAVWGIIYATLPDDSCPNPETSVIDGSYKTSSGNRASRNSEDAALRDQRSKPIGSTHKIYYNHNSCKSVRFSILNPQEWEDVLISSGAIGGFGVFLLFISMCIIYQPYTACFRCICTPIKDKLKSRPIYQPETLIKPLGYQPPKPTAPSH